MSRKAFDKCSVCVTLQPVLPRVTKIQLLPKCVDSNGVVKLLAR